MSRTNIANAMLAKLLFESITCHFVYLMAKCCCASGSGASEAVDPFVLMKIMKRKRSNENASPTPVSESAFFAQIEGRNFLSIYHRIKLRLVLLNVQ